MQLNFRKALRSTAVLAVVILAFFMLFLSKDVAEGIKNGITIVIEIIIPSLFAFMALSVFFANTFLSDCISRILRPVVVYLYRLPVSVGYILFMSMIGGYPVGAKLISDRLRSGTLDEKTASRMMCYCVNAGPAFVITAVGLGMYHSLTTGLFLFLSQILSSMLMGIFIGRMCKPVYVKEVSRPKMHLLDAFVYSVNSAAKSLFSISIFIVIFSGILSFLQASGIMELFTGLFSSFIDEDLIQVILTGILEVTNGCQTAASSSFGCSLSLTAFFLSFSGISILFQIVSLFYPLKISFKSFLLCRIIHGLLTAGLFFVFASLFPQSVVSSISLVHPIFANNAYSVIASICLLCMGVILILSIHIRRKDSK